MKRFCVSATYKATDERLVLAVNPPDLDKLKKLQHAVCSLGASLGVHAINICLGDPLVYERTPDWPTSGPGADDEVETSDALANGGVILEITESMEQASGYRYLLMHCTAEEVWFDFYNKHDPNGGECETSTLTWDDLKTAAEDLAAGPGGQPSPNG